MTVEAASDLAKYRKSLSTPDEEEIETIGWDDTPVPSRIGKFHLPLPHSKSLSTPDEEEIETIGWDDTPVPSRIGKFHPPPSTPSIKVRVPQMKKKLRP